MRNKGVTFDLPGFQEELKTEATYLAYPLGVPQAPSPRETRHRNPRVSVSPEEFNSTRDLPEFERDFSRLCNNLCWGTH